MVAIVSEIVDGFLMFTDLDEEEVADMALGQSSRGWGLTLDTIVGVDVVLANGSLAHANATSYTDIFWVSLTHHANTLPTDIHRLSVAQQTGNELYESEVCC